MKEFDKILIEICQELNIKLSTISDDWVKIFEKDHKIKYLVGFKFSSNDHAIGNILDDKGLFYELLTLKNYPIIEHKVIFKETNEDIIKDYFYKNNQEIVLKGNIGSLGNEVFLIKDINDLLNKIDYLFKSQYSLSLCPYYDILHEYRTIILDNKVMFVYGKNKPKIIGDGISTIKELAINFNKDYYLNYDFENNNYIPKKDEIVELNWQFNLSKGATYFENIDDKLKDKIINMATNIVKDINIKFASIDIIETKNHELLVMEGNSGVMMDNVIKQNIKNRDIVKNIYKEAIIKMFNE